MGLLIGTSGWQYRDWRGGFYPAALPARGWLEHYATRFPTVENNATFYRLPGRDTFAGWRARTPDGFVMAVKASRYLTHLRRLREPGEPAERLLAAAAGLGSRLGPVLLQLPPDLRADPPLLDACLAGFAAAARALRLAPPRVCVEFRHRSWDSEATRQVLAGRNAAVCWSDRLGRPAGPLWRTADWGYLRLHEGAAAPRPRYGRKSLRSWLDRISAAFDPAADFFVYFNNDAGGAAPADAAALAGAADRAGRPAARPPGPGS